MNLTALIAELFVGGVLCLLWLALLFSAYFDTRVLVAFLKDNPLGGPAMFSVIAYALGVIFDRVWDAVLKRFDDAIEVRYFPAKEDLRAARRRIFGKEKDGVDFIDYIRSRMRIARACLCNGVLLGIAGGIFYARTVPAATPGGFVAIGGATVLFSLVSFFALNDLTNTYYRALGIFGKESPRPNAAQPTPSVMTPTAAPPPAIAANPERRY